MVVAQIAYNHLDPAVKAKCDALIAVSLPPYDSPKTSNFVTAAVWADDFKSSLGTGNSHFIDIPISLDGYPTNGVNNNSANVVLAIRQEISTLQNNNATQADQATALRYLIHFVGDIQQPMHCSTGVSTNNHSGDSGGNGFSLTGTWSNLHSLWDDGGGSLPDSLTRPLNATDQATLNTKVAAIEADYPYSFSVGGIPDPMDWATESHGLAATIAYVGITNGTTPTASYVALAQSTAEQRVAIGGQRLAKLLNTIFVTNAPSVISLALTNTNFGFTWSSVSGRTYRVQWKQQITDPTWTDLADVTASTNLTSFTTNSIAPPQRLFRAIVVN